MVRLFAVTSDWLQPFSAGYNRAHNRASPCIRGKLYERANMVCRGSSPRIRGKLQEISSPLNNHRCIPVYTGANNRFLTRHTSCLGSSPCIRGGFSSIPVGPERCGFIPARGGRSNSRIMSHATIRFIPVHTGQMQFCFHLTAVRTAHPRTYGADQFSAAGKNRTLGSSPYIRGGY